MRLLLFLILFPATAMAQTISFAPTSFTAWGVTPSVSSISIEYKGVGIRTIIPYNTEYDKHFKKTRSLIGVSYKKDLANFMKVGAIVFNKPFPTDSGQRFNFVIDIGFTVDIFRVSYVHISNGYTSDFNPGMDLLSIGINL